MTQETEEAPLELALVSCQTCDLAFIGSERRTTCPTCGGEAAGPYFRWVLEVEGLRLVNGALPETAEPPPVVASAEPPAVEVKAPPPAEEPPSVAEAPLSWETAMVADMVTYLAGGDVDEDYFRDALEGVGVKGREARMTVQRLTAIRDTIARLTASTEEETEAPAEEAVEEDGPEPSPEPAMPPESV